MLKIVESGIDPVDSYSRWWRVARSLDDENSGSCILKSSVAHCCTLAAIQSLYATYGDYQVFFKELHAFLKDFEKHRNDAQLKGVQVQSPLWVPKTWVYFNSNQERIDDLLTAIPSARVVHSFKNTAHPPHSTVHQVMFEV